MMRSRQGQQGMALVVVLVVVTILVALVTEFVYGVSVQTSAFTSWQAGQRLSLNAESGAALASYVIEKGLKSRTYTHPGSVSFPPYDPFKQDITVALRVEDENAKFNLNSLVYPSGEVDEKAYARFSRVLKGLGVGQAVADAAVDYIDADSISRGYESERSAPNRPMQSPEELLLVAGVDRAVYNTLTPYVTVWGSGQVNINGAEAPVLMGLSDQIDADMAERVIQYRNLSAFTDVAEIVKVAGFESLGLKLQGLITVKGTAFRVYSEASEQDGLRRTIECVIADSGTVSYWRER